MRDIRISPIIETGQIVAAHHFCTGEKCRAAHEEHSLSPTIGFPTKGVFVKRDALGTHVVENTAAVLFNAGQPYEIDHPAACPDHTWFIELRDCFFADAWREFGEEERFFKGQPFPKGSVPLAPGDWLRAAELYKSITAFPDALSLQENVFTLLDWLLPKAFDPKAMKLPVIEKKAARVAAAQIYLAENFREDIQLQDLASVTQTSPFHLCRIFREGTGFAIHEHLTRLRLRAALEALRDRTQSITAIGLDLGFNSPSHFSASFHKMFGFSPSTYRARFC